MVNYTEEKIPDDSKLFYRIHQSYIDTEESDNIKKIKPGAFDPCPRPDSVELSVNWDKYSDASKTKVNSRKPKKNGVVSFVAGTIRKLPLNLNVKHQPTSNRAHSIIHDVLSTANDPEVRLALRKNCAWEITI